MPTVDEFRTELQAQLRRAAERQAPHYEANAGELHRLLGGYPAVDHCMPVACEVMRAEMAPGDKVMHNGDTGDGAALTIRYLLPRGV